MIHPEEYPTNRRYLLDRVDDGMLCIFLVVVVSEGKISSTNDASSAFF